MIHIFILILFNIMYRFYTIKSRLEFTRIIRQWATKAKKVEIVDWLKYSFTLKVCAYYMRFDVTNRF